MGIDDGKTALLVVSFGTSFADTRPRTIDAVEESLRTAFPGCSFYRAWTSDVLRKKLEKEGRHVFSVAGALERMGADGVKEVIVQPTHLLYGKEYRHIYETVSSYMGQFIKVSVGDPLLADENDVTTLAGILEQKYPAEEGELLVLMGHGSADMSFPAYDLLERQFRLDGYEQMCIGTVEFEPGIGSILARVRQEKPSRVHLVPLLIAAGGHVINDMAGDGQDSWKNQISREGTDVNCHMTGLGELEAVREMYIQHAKSAREITGDAEK